MEPFSAPTRCSTCGDHNHASLQCPNQEAQAYTRKVRANAARLLEVEPYARSALMRGVPPASFICARHRQQGVNTIPLGDPTDTTQPSSILQHRALMPMCARCATGWFRDMNNTMHPFDTCVCAAMIFESKNCAWCGLENLQQRRKDYIMAYCEAVPIADQNGGQQIARNILRCACGAMPMWMEEALRLCAGCRGVVTVPLHALDGTTHLYCPIGGPSRRLIGEEGGSMDLRFTGSSLECIAHPVRPLVQSLRNQLVASEAEVKARRLSRASMQSSGGGQTLGSGQSTGNAQSPGNGQPVGSGQPTGSGHSPGHGHTTASGTRGKAKGLHDSSD